MRQVINGIALALVVVGVVSAQAQTPREGHLTITVADQTGAVLPGATVTVLPQGGPSAAPVVPPVQTSADGIATVTGLPLGRYTVQVAFPGFDTGTLDSVNIRAGDNRQRIVLALARVEDKVVVGQDAETAASDRARAFGSALTREQIDALSDDPDEARRQLIDMVGGDAVIRVDTFEGAPLPPKSQIRSIRVSRDAFAAEFHQAGGIFVDVVTQPGAGPIRGGVNTRLRPGALSGRSPFVTRKNPERTQDYGISLGGALLRDRLGFNVNLNGTSGFETPSLNAALQTGVRSEVLGIRMPRRFLNANAQVDYALTRDQVLRIGFGSNSNSFENQGVGLYDLPERAFSTDNRNYNLRIQEVGPLGRRFFMNTRVFVTWQNSESTSAVEAPTIRVNDAFTAGGQQVSGGRRTRGFNLASDLDYVRGIHSVRMGVALDSLWAHSDSFNNYLGTYTFESLDAYLAQRPRSYTRRIGDPNIDYFNFQGAMYIQDDIRVRPGLTLTPGVRYEAQTHVRDLDNFGPRFGVTWSPRRNGRTTVRASTGIFYDWLSSGTYEQTLRVDGFRQQEINIANPSFPEPGLDGNIPPLNKYLLGTGVRMPRTLRFSGGIDRTLTPLWRLGMTYAHMRGASLQRGLNRNAPMDGIRPDPSFVNIVEVVSDARARQHTVSFNVDGGLAPAQPPIVAATGPLVNWKRIRFFANYTLGWNRNNTDGDFSLAPGGTLDDEWGFAPQDVRHRINASVNTQIVRNLTVSMNTNASTGTPYTLRTGFDDNGDLVFNDRPAGVARNTGRAAAQWAMNLNTSYAMVFGRRATPPPPGILISVVGNQAPTVQSIAVDWRYRLQFFVNVQNVTNRANYVGYSGIMTSPFFGRPTAVSNPRKVDMGISLQF